MNPTMDNPVFQFSHDESHKRVFDNAICFAERVEPIWNLRGVLCNPWHRVKVNVPTETPEEKLD
jgi:hypothetical protein